MTRTYFDDPDSVIAKAVRQLKAHLKTSPPFVDAVSHGAKSPTRLSPQTVGGNADAIYRNLGHIAANPGRGLNSSLLRESYVYAEGAPERERGDLVVNRSAADAEAFVRTLVDAAALERERAEASVVFDEDTLERVRIEARARARFFVLRGQRGVGKTFFLNHLLCRYEEIFDQEKIVWVRLNLPISRGFDSDLEHWVNAQIAKILTRYYDEKSDYAKRRPQKLRLPIIASLMKWAAAQPEADRAAAKSSVTRLEQAFTRRGQDDDISPDLATHEICAEIRRIALNYGLGFVVVFDGFDRLDYDIDSSDRFLTIRSGLERLATGSANTNAVYLCVSRTTTFKALLAKNPYIRARQDNTFVAFSPPIEEIVRARIEGLIRWSKGQADVDAGGREGFTSVVEGFREHLFNETGSRRTEPWSFLEIDRALDNNSRAKTQIMQIEFLDYLASTASRDRYKYRLVEYLTCAGKTYPPIIYEYPLGRRNIRARIVESTDHDTRFLPTVFRPPIPSDAIGQTIWEGHFDITSTLHQLRVLQLLLADWKLEKAKQRYAAISIGDICDILASWFGYSPEVTRLIILELETYELLDVDRRNFGVELDDSHSVELLPKGERFVRDFVFEVAYLNLSAMRLLVPPSVHLSHLITLAPVPGAINGEDARAVLGRWIRAKVRNAITCFALLLIVNHEQEQRLLAHQPDEERFENEFWVRGVHLQMIAEIRGWQAPIFDELDRMLNAATVGQGLLTGDDARTLVADLVAAERVGG